MGYFWGKQQRWLEWKQDIKSYFKMSFSDGSVYTIKPQVFQAIRVKKVRFNAKEVIILLLIQICKVPITSTHLQLLLDFKKQKLAPIPGPSFPHLKGSFLELNFFCSFNTLKVNPPPPPHPPTLPRQGFSV